MFIHLATKSLLHRKGSIALTVLAMSMSIFVLLGVEHVRHQAKTTFASSVSGVDLIVGSRTGNLNLLLYSVFRIGSPTNNISWHSYQQLAQNNSVRWAIPISLGDSHRGFRVLGTTTHYFDHFSYGSKQLLSFKEGEKFSDIFEIVLGAQVAKKWGYKLGDNITLAHGIGSTSFKKHDELPFQVVGILHTTGTPVDQTLHVNMRGLEAVHLPNPAALNHVIRSSKKTELEEFYNKSLTPKSVTAVMVGLKSKIAVFTTQRQINSDTSEPLTAILPGVVLAELWQTMSVFENTLRLITVLVFISSLIALCAMLLSSIRERSQEIKLLRIIGSSSGFIFWLIQVEAMIMAFLSTLISIGLLNLTLLLCKNFILSRYGIAVDINVLSHISALIIIGIFIFTFLAAIPAAIIAYTGAKNGHV